MSRYPVIFVGRVIRNEPYWQGDRLDSHERIVRFEVSEVFAGDVYKQYGVRANKWGNQLVTGRTYLLFARLSTNNTVPFYDGCSSKEVSHIDVSLDDLGDSYAPLSGSGGVPSHINDNMTRNGLIGIAFFWILVGGIWLMASRNKSPKEADADKLAAKAMLYEQ